VGVLCRDHRGAVATMVAAGKLGARLVLLNTGFSGVQLADVVRREGVGGLVYDDDADRPITEPGTADRIFAGNGRSDDMIVSGGENVFPGEVEDLVEGMQGVAEVASVAVPDEDFGQRLRLYVVPAAGAELDAEQIRAHVRNHLARFKVPREVLFLDELPRTATGKVDRRALNGAAP
jgi:acyl-CoA synthetase (AMP-forming)/AMP-acid ligase II